MAANYKDYRKEYDKKFAEIEKMANSYVTIGFHENSVTRSQVKGQRRKEAGLSMAGIAAQNEFGTRTIPARPFMTTSFDENRQRISQIIDAEYTKIIDGESTVKRSLSALGLFMVDLIQTKIRAIHYPPNSPRTIAAKKSSKPLIDFGQMIEAVKSKVVIQ